jgi:hypothetical protein
MYYFLQ